MTEDKDFGQLFFANKNLSGAVIFFRFPAPARFVIAKTVVEFIQFHKNKLHKSFVVIQPGHIRITKKS